MFFLRTLVVSLLLTASAFGQGWSYSYSPDVRSMTPQQKYDHYDSQIPKPVGSFFGIPAIERTPKQVYVTQYTWGSESQQVIKKPGYTTASGLHFPSKYMVVEERPWWKFW